MNIVGPFIFGKRAFLFQIYAQKLDFCVLQWLFISFWIYLDLLSRAMVPNYIHHQHCWRAPSSGKPHEDLLCVGLQIMDVWAGVWWYPRVVCICISPLMRDGDLFFSPIAYCPLYRRFQGMSIQDFFPSFTWVVGFVLLLGGVSC